MIYSNKDKIGKFWDRDEYLEKNIEVELASKILSLKQKCLDKVETGEWTQVECDQFIRVVKKIEVERFIGFYKLAILYLDLSNEECLNEINNLNNSGLIKPDVISTSFHELMAKSIYDFYGRMLSLSRIELTEAEKVDRLAKLENNIKIYEDILNQLKNPESDYTMVIKETFRTIVEKSIKNSLLKDKVLELETDIIKLKIQHTRKLLSRNNSQLNEQKNCLCRNCYQTGSKKQL